MVTVAASAVVPARASSAPAATAVSRQARSQRVRRRCVRMDATSPPRSADRLIGPLWRQPLRARKPARGRRDTAAPRWDTRAAMKRRTDEVEEEREDELEQ